MAVTCQCVSPASLYSERMEKMGRLNKNMRVEKIALTRSRERLSSGDD